MEDELKLDRKRSFGTVYNHPEIGFVQDGKHYRHNGTLLVETVPEPARPASTPAPVVTKNGTQDSRK